MSWTLVTTASFERRARKFLLRHPDLRPRFIETLELLQRNPFEPSLCLHTLSGRLLGVHAIRLTFSYRITLTLQVSAQDIVLLDIGSHDEMYG